MPYIGRNTDKLSNVEVLDNITFDGSQSYTLQKNSVNFTPSSANTLLISIDGVVQAGNFTVSGSTVDFGVAVASSSTCDFILHYGVGLITTPADGTVSTAKLASDAVTNTKLAASIINSQTAETSIAGGDEVLIYDTSASALRKMTRTNFVSGVGGDNTPAFQAHLSSNQTISDNAFTKIQCNTEIFDTDSAYDNSTNYRFTVPSGEGGKYFVVGNIGAFSSSNDIRDAYLSIYKNGSFFHEQRHDNYTNFDAQIPLSIGSIMNLSAGDYIELYGVINTNGGGSGLILGDSSTNKTFFGAYKLIGV